MGQHWSPSAVPHWEKPGTAHVPNVKKVRRSLYSTLPIFVNLILQFPLSALTGITLCVLRFQIQFVVKALLESEEMSAKVRAAMMPCSSNNSHMPTHRNNAKHWTCLFVFFPADYQMWMSVKCSLECVSMASASTRQAPFSASALQEWLLMSAAGRALVRITAIH